MEQNASISSRIVEQTEESYAGLLVDRLAAAIVDDSLPLKEVERDLRGSVADVAIHKRGLGKRETAHRCGVTEKSIENYLREARNNPKSPEREIARILQDEMLSIEQVFARVQPVITLTRNFTLDDAKRSLEKLIRTGEVEEFPGHLYRAIARPCIRYPKTAEAHRELVDQKARDLDYIVLRQKEASDEEVARRGQRFSRVVGDTNLVRIDFTVNVEPDELSGFYEKLSESIAKLTMKEEKKKGRSRVRVVLGMRSVAPLVAFLLTFFSIFLTGGPRGDLEQVIAQEAVPVERDAEGQVGDPNGRSWELDRVAPGQQPAPAERPDVDVGQGIGVNPDEDEPADDDPDGDSEDEFPHQIGEQEVDVIDGAPFLRGDVNVDERIDVADIIVLVCWLEGEGETELPCLDGADVDDNGRIDIVDAAELFVYLFDGDPDQDIVLRYAPDTTDDELDCASATAD